MQEVGGQIPALVTLLSLIGAGIAFLLRRRDSQKDPIPKESAAVALAQSSISIMQGIADRQGAEIEAERKMRASDRAEHKAEMTQLHLEMSALHARQKSTEDQLKSTQAELAETRADITWLRDTLGVAASYIEKLLRWARSDSRPPLPPLPEKLRTLIDPSLHTNEEEP